MAKIVGYSKNAEYRGQKGYLLWEGFDPFRGDEDQAKVKTSSKLIHWKTPIPQFLKHSLR